MVENATGQPDLISIQRRLAELTSKSTEQAENIKRLQREVDELKREHEIRLKTLEHDLGQAKCTCKIDEMLNQGKVISAECTRLSSPPPPVKVGDTNPNDMPIQKGIEQVLKPPVHNECLGGPASENLREVNTHHSDMPNHADQTHGRRDSNNTKVDTFSSKLKPAHVSGTTVPGNSTTEWTDSAPSGGDGRAPQSTHADIAQSHSPVDQRSYSDVVQKGTDKSTGISTMFY